MDRAKPSRRVGKVLGSIGNAHGTGRRGRVRAVGVKGDYVVLRLPNGKTVTARKGRDGTLEVVTPERTAAPKYVVAGGATKAAPEPTMSESSYRELMAVLEMEDTGRSRRGSL